MELDELTDKIASGAAVPQSELLPHLGREGKLERSRINYRLAQAYVQAGNYRQAKVCIERAWLFSGFSRDYFDLLKQIHLENDDIEALREACKRLGIRYAREGNTQEALNFFNQWHYAHATYRHSDTYSYDADILAAVEDLARPLLFPAAEKCSPDNGRKIRLAYLVFGATHSNSVLLKIIKSFARYHDKRRFEVAFFIPESVSLLKECGKNIKEYQQFFKSCAVKVFFTPDSPGEERLYSCGRQIHAFQPDILVTSAAMADFEHFYIAALRPAPIVIGLLQGPPAQFVAPGLDHAISWSRHPLIDSPLDTTFVKLGVELPSLSATSPIKRDTLAIPEKATVMMSAGRYMKFQNGEYWQHILTLLKTYEQLYFVVVGAQLDQIAVLKDLDIADVKDRLRFLGWRSDCVSLMTVADLLIDTYPSGGGHVLLDAMALGVPIVSFENNYLHAFDQTDWSVAEEFVDIPELIVPRGDFCRFVDAVGKLISDKGYRNRMSELCASEVRVSMPTPEAGVQLLEQVYVQLLESIPAVSHDACPPASSAEGRRSGFIQRCKEAIKSSMGWIAACA